MAVQHQIGDDLGQHRGHAETDLEAAIQHELPRPPRPNAQQWRPRPRTRPDPSPAVHHRRAFQRRAQGAGAGDHILQQRVHARMVPAVFRGRADPHRPIRVRHDVQPVGIDLRRIRRIEQQRRALALHALPDLAAQILAQHRQTRRAGGPDGGTGHRLGPGGLAQHDLAPLGGDRGGQCRPGHARRQARGQIVHQPPAIGAFGGQRAVWAGIA